MSERTGGPEPAGAAARPPGGGDAASILGFLRRLRLLLWGVALGGGLLRVGAVAAAAALLNVIVAERSAAPPWPVFILSLTGSVAFWTASLRFLRSLRYPGWTAAARRVETLAPAFLNDIESSLELAPRLERPADGPLSRPLIRALIGRTGERMAAFSPRRFVPWHRLAGGAGLLLATSAPLAAVALLPPGVPRAAVLAVADPRVYWPYGQLALQVEPGDTRVARGADLTVRVRAAGGRPAAVALRYEGPSGEEGIAEMTRGPEGRYSWRFVAVMNDFRYRVQAGAVASPWYRVRVVESPAAGNFEVTYTYPAYTGLGVRRTAGSGDLEALRGTGVEISFAVNKDLARGAVVMGGSRTEAGRSGERRYRATVHLNGEQSYRLELEDREGFRNDGGATYAIRYLPDAPPVVELLEPTGAVETDLRAPLLIRYRAVDDYGLARLALVARLASGERRQALPLAAAVRSAAGEYAWDLGELQPGAGEAFTAHIEATDNDTITGPKTSTSAVITIQVIDPRKKREEIDETMQKLADDLLQLLGEELELQERYQELRQQADEQWGDFDWRKMEEAATRQQAAREAAARAEDRAAALTDQLERAAEEKEETLFQAEMLKRGLAELRERQLTPMREMAAGMTPADAPREEVKEKTGFLSQYAAAAAEAAEQLSLMATAMQKERRMADVGRSAGAMARSEDRLLDELDKLAPDDRKAAAEIIKQLDEIGKSLRELAQALAKENKELPEEFLNSDAVKDLDVGRILDEIERIKELLRKGDIAGARKAARELAAQLADLRNRLDRASGEFEEKFARALARLQGNTVPELERLADEQRALLERTESIERAAGPRLEEALRRMVRERNTAPPPAEADLLTPDERLRVEALSREQEALRQRAEKLAVEMAAVRAALPFLSPAAGKNLELAVGSMAEARDNLAQRAPGTALPPERAALAALTRSKKSAQGGLDEMKQMQGMRQGSSGMPMAMGRRPGEGSTVPSPGRSAGGRRGTDVRNFMIPGKEDFRAPRLFREEILKSLREGYPLQYEERIKDYYQRIAE